MYELLHRCQRRSRQFAGIFVLLGLLGALATGAAGAGPIGYVQIESTTGTLVTVCLMEPADGATLSGPAEVKATASGWGWGVVEVVFSLDGQYLLTDTEAPYTFVLPTTHFANGEHTLSARAVMRDGSALSRACGEAARSPMRGTPTPAPKFTPVAPDAPADGQSLVVAATGDGAGGEINADRVSEMVDGWNPDLFLYLGDVYEEGTYTEFYNWYGT